jgi:RNA polymerase sigma-70 factor (ECF subfamily)
MSGSSLPSSTLQRATTLDAEAWKRVHALYFPLLYGRCRRNGLEQKDAEDVVQSVFLAAIKSIASFHRDGPTSCFRAWLLGITNNKLKDYWETRAKNPPAEGGSLARERLDQLAAPSDASSVNDDAEVRARLIQRALELIKDKLKCEDRTWTAFLRFDIEGKPAAEIASELGISANAVHIAACRIRKRLRKELADLL